LIRPLFQPIVDLDSGDVVGVEALARGPAGPLHTPMALFEVANQVDRLHELDSLCRLTAITTARDAAAHAPPLVFVNVEPGTVDLPMSAELRAVLSRDLPFQIVVEFTERALTRRLPALLRHADEIRARGNAVALDDIGVGPRSVAVLPLVQPEIVKLDMSLLAPGLPAHATAAAAAVEAYAARTGAVVVAEGIETDEQRLAARRLGARWGQGWLFGRPGPMDELAAHRVRAIRPRLSVRTRSDAEGSSTPFDLAVSVGEVPLRVDGARVRALSRELEGQARALADLGVVMLALQDVRNLNGATATAYASIALKAAAVGILGRGVPAVPLPGAYGVDLAIDDPLTREWVIAVLGPGDAVVLTAHEVGTAELLPARAFDVVLSHDRDLVERTARLLARRLTPRAAILRTTAVADDPG